MRRWILRLATWVLVLALAPALSAPFIPGPANAGTADADPANKAEWQDRYRTIRNDALRMRANATKIREAFSLSHHSNYPRGEARERYKQQVLETERKADEYEAKMASFLDEARRNQIPPGWIYEVDDEPVRPSAPAAMDGGGRTRSMAAPEGRNPAYYDGAGDEDENAGDEPKDDRGEGFGDFNDDREDQYRIRDVEPPESNAENSKSDF